MNNALVTVQVTDSGIDELVQEARTYLNRCAKAWAPEDVGDEEIVRKILRLRGVAPYTLTP